MLTQQIGARGDMCGCGWGGVMGFGHGREEPTAAREAAFGLGTSHVTVHTTDPGLLFAPEFIQEALRATA
jgi:hypothetical protein